MNTAWRNPYNPPPTEETVIVLLRTAGGSPLRTMGYISSLSGDWLCLIIECLGSYAWRKPDNGLTIVGWQPMPEVD